MFYYCIKVRNGLSHLYRVPGISCRNRTCWDLSEYEFRN